MSPRYICKNNNLLYGRINRSFWIADSLSSPDSENAAFFSDIRITADRWLTEMLLFEKWWKETCYFSGGKTVDKTLPTNGP